MSNTSKKEWAVKSVKLSGKATGLVLASRPPPVKEEPRDDRVDGMNNDAVEAHVLDREIKNWSTGEAEKLVSDAMGSLERAQQQLRAIRSDQSAAKEEEEHRRAIARVEELEKEKAAADDTILKLSAIVAALRQREVGLRGQLQVGRTHHER